MREKVEAKKADAEAYQEADRMQRHPKELQDVRLPQAIILRLDHSNSRKSTLLQTACIYRSFIYDLTHI